MKRFACVLALVLGVGVGPASAGVIDTVSLWNGWEGIASFGMPHLATFGQTFTVDAGLGTQLDSFTFFLDKAWNSGIEPTPFAAYLAAWDGEKMSGAPLYQSEARLLPSDEGFAEFTFNTGGVQLTAGMQYVAFLSVSEYFLGDMLATMGFVSSDWTGDVYAGGTFVNFDSRDNFGALAAEPWGSSGDFGDAAFRVNFSAPPNVPAVPEPTSLCLLGTGLGLLGHRLRRRNMGA